MHQTKTPGEKRNVKVERRRDHGVARWEGELLRVEEASDGSGPCAVEQLLQDVVQDLGAGGDQHKHDRCTPATLPSKYRQQDGADDHHRLRAHQRDELCRGGELGRGELLQKLKRRRIHGGGLLLQDLVR